MTSDDASDPVPDAVPVAVDETVLWTGSPRLSAALPAVFVGLVVAGVGMGVAVGPAADTGSGLAVGAVAVLVGLSIPALAVLSLVNTRYVLTDRAAGVKTGVVGRRVDRARLSMVENSSYEQSATGSLFGYGTVTLETAGGGVSFQRVDDPSRVRSLVDEHVGGDDQTRDSIPGSLDSWRAVREEVRRLRAALVR